MLYCILQLKYYKKEKILMKMQSNAGITIIALIVAIIVILILSMISISVLTGDNSIINKANEANVETRAANVEEEKNLWKTEQKVSKYSKNKTYTTLQELLDKLEKNKQRYRYNG